MKLNLSGYTLYSSHIMGYLTYNYSIALTVPTEVLNALSVISTPTDNWFVGKGYLWVLQEHPQYTQLMEHLAS
jgi:hypothetical protein